MVLMVFLDHMLLNNLHDKQQPANTETAVLRVHRDISAALDNGLCCYVTTGLVCSIWSA